jgi:hypothetical protein
LLWCPLSPPERPFFRGSSYRIVPGAGFLDVSLAPCHFCRAGRPHSGGVQLLQCGPQCFWVQLFLTMFLFRHATFAWRDTFLQAIANFLGDPQFPRVSSFGAPHRPAVDFRPVCRFFRPKK